MEEDKKNEEKFKYLKIIPKKAGSMHILGNHLIIDLKKDEVKEFAGKPEMTDKELKNRVRAVISIKGIIAQNGEEAKKKIEKKVEKEEIKNEEESKLNKKMLTILKWVSIATIGGLVLAGSVRACSNNTPPKDPNIIHTSNIVYDVGNSAEYPYLVLGQEGQEGATARLVGAVDIDDPMAYDDQLHAEKENVTIESYQKFEDLKNRFQEKMDRLEDNSLSNEEKTSIFKEVVALSRDMVTEYNNNKVLIEQYQDDFMKQTDLYPDEKTILEKRIINDMYTRFMEQYGLSIENETVFEMFETLFNMGYEITDFSLEKNMVGEKTNFYKIDATLIEKLVTEQEKIDESSEINKIFNGESIEKHEEERNDE